jgi:hypothetical protein
MGQPQRIEWVGQPRGDCAHGTRTTRPCPSTRASLSFIFPLVHDLFRAILLQHHGTARIFFVLFLYLLLESVERMVGVSASSMIDAMPLGDPFGALVVLWVIPWCLFWIWDSYHKAKARRKLSGSEDSMERLYHPDRWTVAFHLICASFMAFVGGHSTFYVVSWDGAPVYLTVSTGLILAAIPVAYLYHLVCSLNTTIRIAGQRIENCRFSTCSKIDLGEIRKVKNMAYWLDMELKDGTSVRLAHPLCRYEDWAFLFQFLLAYAKRNREK